MERHFLCKIEESMRFYPPVSGMIPVGRRIIKWKKARPVKVAGVTGKSQERDDE